jgi:hypothetical protein
VSNPAATSEAAAVGVIFPVATPICVATITNVSVVACSRPAAAARRVPVRRRYSSAGNPRTSSRASRNSGTSAIAAGCARRLFNWKETPVVMKKIGIRKPNPMPSSFVWNCGSGLCLEISISLTSRPAANAPRIDAKPNW